MDNPEYSEKADLRDYVMARLLREGEEGTPTPRAKKEFAAQLAERVAEQSYPNFLITRLVTEELAIVTDSMNGPSISTDVGGVIGTFLGIAIDKLGPLPGIGTALGGVIGRFLGSRYRVGCLSTEQLARHSTDIFLVLLPTNKRPAICSWR